MEDVNLWMRDTYKFLENQAPLKCNDSTEFINLLIYLPIYFFTNAHYWKHWPYPKSLRFFILMNNLCSFSSFVPCSKFLQFVPWSKFYSMMWLSTSPWTEAFNYNMNFNFMFWKLKSFTFTKGGMNIIDICIINED